MDFLSVPLFLGPSSLSSPARCPPETGLTSSYLTFPFPEELDEEEENDPDRAVGLPKDNASSSISSSSPGFVI